MMKITVLAGISACKKNCLNVKSENGLSLFIESDERRILFDTGQSDLFIQNAEIMGIDLSQVHYLVISHRYFDHGSGLKHFLEINKRVKIFLHINAAPEFYTRIFGLSPVYVATDQKITAQSSRIHFIEEDTQIEEKIILLKGFPGVPPEPEGNKSIFDHPGNRFVIEKFSHEIVMLLIENDEIVLFSGCLDSGIINRIEEVRLFSRAMRIKATIGGFRIHNPISKKILTMISGQVFEV